MNTISVRARGGEDLGEMSVDDFIQKLHKDSGRKNNNRRIT